MAIAVSFVINTRNDSYLRFTYVDKNFEMIFVKSSKQNEKLGLKFEYKKLIFFVGSHQPKTKGLY